MATRSRKQLIMPNGAQPNHEVAALRAAGVGGWDDEDDRPSPVIAGEQDSLMDLLAGFTDAATVTVKVYRVIKNKPLAYVFECSPESFSMDELRDVHGGGEFRVYIHKDRELIKNVRVMVEPKPRAVPSEVDAALAGMRDHMAKTDKVLEALLLRQSAPPPPPSLGDMLGKLDLPATIAAIGTLLQVLRPPAPVLPPPPPPADPSGSIDLLLKGIELAKELKGEGGGGETGLMDVVRDLIKSPMLGQAIAAAAQQQQPQAVPMAPRPHPGPQAARLPAPQRPAAPPAPPPAQPVPATSLEDMTAQLQQTAQQPTMGAMIPQYMGLLTAQAAAGSDPELYAGLILDQLDDDTLTMLLDRKPDPVSALIADYPPAAPYREWFAAVVEYIQGAFEEAGDQDGMPVESSDAPGPDATLIVGGPSAG